LIGGGVTKIDLSNRVAVVTGASQGLGEAIAIALGDAGASVAINYFPDAEQTNRGRAEAVSSRVGGMIVPADVRDEAQVRAMFEQVQARFGRLDMVINNAGVLRDRTMKKLTSSLWQEVIDTNLTGVFNVCRAGAELMSDGGRIVSLSSISAAMGFFGQANYAAAKAGVVGLTRVLSRELARRRITVNAVAPGVVLTEMGLSIPESSRTEMLKNIPLGRFAEPREIADVVLFLCSDLASYMTGQTLHVNGGWYA
jgi:3-oxoacyl-[acyl-carrier protein] reductase